MPTTDKIAIDTQPTPTVNPFPGMTGGATGPVSATTERRRAVRHALFQLQREAIDLGMPLTGHLLEAAAEAAADESA